MIKWLEWLFPFLKFPCWSCNEPVSRFKANRFFLKTNEGISEYQICGSCAKVLEAMKLQQQVRPDYESKSRKTDH